MMRPKGDCITSMAKRLRLSAAFSEMKKLFLEIGFTFCAGILSLQAVGPGDEVIVVYNTQLPDSKAVAGHYAELRQVPASQVFGFALSTGEDMSRAEFR